ncbi:MAG: hypothetical protein ABSF23_10400 [Terracidiphilus sp.]|jgi:hypothetical protein
MRKGIILAIAGLAFLGGCNQKKDSDASEKAKWKVPYHLGFDAKATKPSTAGVTIPDITYTANPKALERRAALVVRFDATGVKNDQPDEDHVIMAPVDVPGTAGALPDDYMDQADQKLAKSLAGYCMKGPVKISVALVWSSIKPDANDAQIDAKRLSDWLPAEVVFKNPHPKCSPAAAGGPGRGAI